MLVIAIVASLLAKRNVVPPPVVLPKPLPEVKVLKETRLEPIKPGDPKESSARADLEKARAFARSRPEDLSAQLWGYSDIVGKWEGTEAAREAAREGAAVKAVIQD